jgi:catechol 2,3-dioxygenase-like lactoylglutathione lyase family enzyme
MIHGAHVIVFSKNAESDRAFFRDVLGYRFTDAGHGWLIFALPPAELAFHPTDGAESHELYLMCDDIHAFIADMKSRGIPTSPVHEERWGLLTTITRPGGGKLGVYEPRHASPLDARKGAPGKEAAKKVARRATKVAAKPGKKVAQASKAAKPKLERKKKRR